MKTVWKWVGMSLAFLLTVIGILLLTSFLYNRNAVRRWLSDPQPPGTMVDIGTHKLYATVRGEGEPAVVMINGLNAFSWGWWEIQHKLSDTTRVLTYDRGGFGWSEKNPEPISSRQIVLELHALLEETGVRPPYIIVGASMGGVYAKHFGKLFPNEVAGAVFVDPSAFSEQMLRDPRIQEQVLKGSERPSLIKIAATLGLVRLFGRRYLRIPRIPDRQFSLLIKALSNPRQHDVSMEQWVSIHRVDENHYLSAPEGFPDVPVRVIVNDIDVMIQDALEVGEIEESETGRTRQYLEAIKERQRRDFMTLSARSEWIRAEGSNHNIQIDRPDLIIEEIMEMVNQAEP